MVHHCAAAVDPTRDARPAIVRDVSLRAASHRLAESLKTSRSDKRKPMA
jgi:hypothetical protein